MNYQLANSLCLLLCVLFLSCTNDTPQKVVTQSGLSVADDASHNELPKKMIPAGDGIVPRIIKSTSAEFYNKKGKLNGYSELTKIEK